MDAHTTVSVGDARDRSARVLRRICVGCGSSVVMLALVVLAGWALGSEPLKRVAPDLPAMTSTTAIGLGLAGLALVCLSPGSRRRRTGKVLGALAALIGMLVLFEYLVTPLGIDQLLFRDQGRVDPGRPSPHTAVALIALGCALLSSRSRRLPGWVHQGSLALSATVAASAVVGYIYDVDYLRGLSGTNGMAVHTLLAVVILTGGALTLEPERGLLGMMRRDGGSAVVARTVIPLAFAPLLVGTALFAAHESRAIGTRLTLSLFTLSMVALVAAMLLVVTVRAQRADARVQEASDRLRAVFDHAPAAISLRGLDGRFIDVNQQGAAILGQSVAELIGGEPGEQAISTAIRDDDLKVSLTRESVTHEARVRHVDGREIDLQIIRYPVVDRRGEVLAVGTFAFDITEQNETIAALELAQGRFRAMFDEAPIGMAVLTLEGRLEQVNDSLCQLLGRTHGQLEGIEIGTLIDDGDVERGAVRRAMLDARMQSRSLEAGLSHAAGHTVAVDIHLALLRDPTGEPLHFLAQIQDITARKRDHAHLSHLADHDPLTGLKNRRAFASTLAMEASENRRRGPGSSLLVIDLDEFKQINDTLGHAAGDELLLHTARVLAQHVRSTDVVARLGGDEFVVLLRETTVRDALTAAENLLSALRTQSPPIPGLTRTVSASIGIAALDGPAAGGPREILRNADRAMYEAKTSGRDRVRVWSLSEPSGFAPAPAV